MMVPYLSSVLSDSILTEDSYTKLDVIDRCYDAINEGVLDNFVVDVAASNTYSMMMEVLDNVKETLLKLVQNVLTFLNNYILNSALLADKYRDLIIQRFKSMKEPFVFYTYEYPKLKSKDYPVLVKSSITLEDEIREMEDEIIRKNLSPDEAASKVDKMLRSFGHDVLDARVDVSDLKSSVKKIIRDEPVLLLDDVLSELDGKRQEHLLSEISNIQTLITCTGLDEFVESRFRMDRVFRVEEGTVECED